MTWPVIELADLAHSIKKKSMPDQIRSHKAAAMRILDMAPYQVANDLLHVITIAQRAIIEEGTHDVANLPAFDTACDIAEVLPEVIELLQTQCNVCKNEKARS